MQDGFEPPLPRPEDRDGMILRHPLAIAVATLLGLLALYLVLFRGPAPNPSCISSSDLSGPGLAGG